MLTFCFTRFFGHAGVAIFSRAAVFAAAGIFAMQSAASAAESRASKTNPDAGESALVLSPFVVAGEKDTGYQATDTLAGTRLRTSLKDIAASISVVTKDMFEDTASTSALDILVYTTGTEAAGINGNFSGSAQTGGIVNQMSFIAERQETSPVNRVRGLAGADTTRNYFATRIPLDAYNTESATINRGSNSILFGLGSPAGIIENTLLTPKFKNRARVQLSTGSYGSVRESADIERVLLKDKLSVRVAALRDEKEYEQKPAYRDQKRLYGAMEYRPFHGTSLRVNAEKGRLDQNLPRIDPPIDAISSWYEYGQLTRANNIWPSGPGGNFNVNLEPIQNFQRLNNLDGTLGQLWGPLAFFADPSKPVVTDSFPSYADDTATAVPVANRVQYRFLVPRPVWEARRFATRSNAIAPPGDPLADFSVYTQITDRNIFDYRKNKIDGPNSDMAQNFTALNAAVEQVFFDGQAGFELVFDSQRTKRDLTELYGAQLMHLKVDVNEQTNDGRPNPNLGRPLLSERGGINRQETRDNTYRATAFVTRDFRRDFRNWFGRALGRQTVTGFYTDNTARIFTIGGYLAVLDQNYFNRSSSIDDRLLGTVTYLGPSLLNTTNVSQARISPITAKLVFPATLASWHLGPQVGSQNRTWEQTTHRVYQGFGDIDYLATNVSATRNEVISWGHVWQGKWLDGLLVSTLGWRHDEIENFTGNNNGLFNSATGARFTNLPHTNSTLFSRDNNFSAGYALHVPERWLQRLPGNLAVSLYYNTSENFQLTGFRQSIYRESIAPQSGTTKEYGIGLGAFRGKLNLRITKYETVQDNMTDSRVTAGGVLNRIAELEQRIYSTNTLADLAARGYVGFNSPDAGPLFKAYAASYNFNLNPTPNSNGFNTLNYAAPGGVVETTRGISRGYEFEAVLNPTSRWRIMFNVAKQESIRGEAANDAAPLIAERMPIWLKDSIKDLTAGTSFDVKGFATSVLDTTVKRAQHSAGQVAQELVPWRANLLTNYTFARESKLHGWAIGGGARWQDRVALGYAPLKDPVLGNLDDLDHPFKGPEQLTFDSWLSYTRPLFNKRIEWKLQLNVRNLLNDNLMIPVKSNPVSLTNKTDFYVAAWRIGEARTWTLTSTFSF
jgi:outer membrane receptor for ferric coprogen and ferric-rhodotorulic acid